MAGCATPTSSAGHAPTGATTNPKLTSQPDHPTGADHFLLNNQGVLVKTLNLPDLTLPFFAPQPFRLLSSGDEIRALLVPLSGPDGAPALWSGGKYRFHFKLTRQRYPQELPDPQAVYAREVEMELEW